jgi:hypothetical protein
MVAPVTGTGLIIRYNLIREDFAVSEDELTMLKDYAQNHWKEFMIGSFSIGIPCGVNALANLQQPFAPLFLNSLVGAVGIILGVAFLIAWQKTLTKLDDIFARIRAKPPIPVQILNFDPTGSSGPTMGLVNQVPQARQE